MTILQRNLRLYRFDNTKPHPELSPKKFQYQLFNNNELLASEYSDSSFKKAIVTVETGKKTQMELINSISDVELQDMQDPNTFLLNVINPE